MFHYYNTILLFFLLSLHKATITEDCIKVDNPKFKLTRTHSVSLEANHENIIHEEITEISKTEIKKTVREYSNRHTDKEWEIGTNTTILNDKAFPALFNWMAQKPLHKYVELNTLVIYASDPRCRIEGKTEVISLEVENKSVMIYMGDFQPLQEKIVFVRTQEELLALNPLYHDLLAIAFMNPEFILKDIWPCYQ